jgi:hypothetical protein
MYTIGLVCSRKLQVMQVQKGNFGVPARHHVFHINEAGAVR